MRSFTSILGTALVGLSLVIAPLAAQQPPARATTMTTQRAQLRAARLARQGHRTVRRGRATERVAAVQRHRARALRAAGHPRASRAVRRNAVRTRAHGAAEIRRGRQQQQRALRLHRRARGAAPAI